jgi:hypothetical protein
MWFPGGAQIQKGPAGESVSSTSTPIGNFDQPVLPIVNPKAFGTVRSAIDAAFSTGRVSDFLKSIDRQGLRIRHFENVLDHGLLGGDAKKEYAALDFADQGQLRELYLASLERVAPELRHKFFKLYAYY